MYGGKWDVIDSKVIVTIPTIIHESVLQELNRHVHMYKRAHNLQTQTKTGYGVPHVSFEVAYSESLDEAALGFGMPSPWPARPLMAGVWLESSLSQVTPIRGVYRLRVRWHWGLYAGAEIKQFQHWKVVPESGPPEYECLWMLTSDDENDHTYVDCRLVRTWKMSDEEQGDIVIPGRSLFVDDEEDDIVLSGAKMWQDLKMCNGLQHGLNVWKTESCRKGGKKRKVNAFEAGLPETLFLAKQSRALNIKM
ncbi:hypothetical protein IW261DRAFT_1564121 [Armillaria novae-zelandiae]|uniref:Uncharacterized protein n=1 Tax=Armillaria novae-zelandiae TaxID=153914 RepID=A0AA39P907_9AGAR|nr:hypothetical protein IW261DRAFT_1564121 [Armillaria novae-zelandiae]